MYTLLKNNQHRGIKPILVNTSFGFVKCNNPTGILTASDMKTCSCCGKLLPLSDFHKDNKSANKHQSQCKNCKKH